MTILFIICTVLIVLNCILVSEKTLIFELIFLCGLILGLTTNIQKYNHHTNRFSCFSIQQRILNYELMYYRYNYPKVLGEPTLQLKRIYSQDGDRYIRYYHKL